MGLLRSPVRSKLYVVRSAPRRKTRARAPTHKHTHARARKLYSGLYSFMNFALFWDITQPAVEIPYRHVRQPVGLI
jgi:hypothetical protein